MAIETVKITTADGEKCMLSGEQDSLQKVLAIFLRGAVERINDGGGMGVVIDNGGVVLPEKLNWSDSRSVNESRSR